MPRYVSTRAAPPRATYTLEHCISTGYDPGDAGLYMPEVIPQVARAELEAWKELSFQDICVAVLAKFSGDEIPLGDLRDIVYEAFRGFSAKSIIPLVSLGSETGVDVFSGELFHGQTYAFKDFGQQILCRLLDYFCRKRKKSATLLVSTTGDTGPAAIAAVKNTNLRIMCFYPKGQISRLQERQMTTVDSPNVFVFPFEGGGDDMDGPIKAISTDSKLSKRYNLCSVNSVNIGRIVAQTVHYFYCYVKSLDIEEIKSGKSLVFAIPTGAMGNVTAGLVAKHMGLPVRKFVCGVNANDILHRAVVCGEFRKMDLKRTLSEAINIQVPYNFERVMYLLSGGQNQQERMAQLETEGSITLPEKMHSKLKNWIYTVRVEDKGMIQTIQYLWNEKKYLSDPHTAVGVYAALKLCTKNRELFKDEKTSQKVVCLATAHACKFEDATCEALGTDFWQKTVLKTPSMMPESAKELEILPEKPRDTFCSGEDWVRRLRDVIVSENPQRMRHPKRSAICGACSRGEGSEASTTAIVGALGIAAVASLLGIIQRCSRF